MRTLFITLGLVGLSAVAAQNLPIAEEEVNFENELVIADDELVASTPTNQPKKKGFIRRNKKKLIVAGLITGAVVAHKINKSNKRAAKNKAQGGAPAGGAPAGEMPQGGAPAGETPAGGAPAGETPAGETPQGETPQETPAQ